MVHLPGGLLPCWQWVIRVSRACVEHRFRDCRGCELAVLDFQRQYLIHFSIAKRRSNETASTSGLPASTLEKTRLSSMMVSSASAERRKPRLVEHFVAPPRFPAIQSLLLGPGFGWLGIAALIDFGGRTVIEKH